MARDRTADLRAIFVAACVAAGAGFAAPDAAAQSLKQGLFGSRPSDGRSLTAPPVARYVSEEGQGFILDRSQGRPLLKFEDSPEVWALQPQPAPRGDIIYKNDLGEPVLRATRLGGVTLFTDSRPAGSAAALAGNGAPLRLAPLSPQALLERLAQASARASRAAKRLIPFDAEATPASSALIADAAMVTAEAVVRMTRRSDGKQVLTRVTRVQLVEGRTPGATLERGVMRIIVAPPSGVAGRPSSDRIMAVAMAR